MEASRSNRWRSTDLLKKKHLSTHVGATAHDDFCWWTYCHFGWCNDPGKLPAKLRWAGFIALRTNCPRYILSRFSRCMSWNDDKNWKSSFWSRNLSNYHHARTYETADDRNSLRGSSPSFYFQFEEIIQSHPSDMCHFGLELLLLSHPLKQFLPTSPLLWSCGNEANDRN